MWVQKLFLPLHPQTKKDKVIRQRLRVSYHYEYLRIFPGILQPYPLSQRPNIVPNMQLPRRTVPRQYYLLQLFSPFFSFVFYLQVFFFLFLSLFCKKEREKERSKEKEREKTLIIFYFFFCTVFNLKDNNAAPQRTPVINPTQ